MKWEMRTSFAHSHCSLEVGIFCCGGDRCQRRVVPYLPGVLATYVLNLVLVEERDAVDDDPRQTTAEVDDLVHEEAHDAGGEDVVADVGVPRRPHALEVVEVDIVL